MIYFFLFLRDKDYVAPGKLKKDAIPSISGHGVCIGIFFPFNKATLSLSRVLFQFRHF